MTVFIIIQLCISYLAIGFLVDVILIKTGQASIHAKEWDAEFGAGSLIGIMFFWPFMVLTYGIYGIGVLITMLLKLVEDGEEKKK